MVIFQSYAKLPEGTQPAKWSGKEQTVGLNMIETTKSGSSMLQLVTVEFGELLWSTNCEISSKYMIKLLIEGQQAGVCVTFQGSFRHRRKSMKKQTIAKMAVRDIPSKRSFLLEHKWNDAKCWIFHCHIWLPGKAMYTVYVSFMCTYVLAYTMQHSRIT